MRAGEGKMRTKLTARQVLNRRSAICRKYKERIDKQIEKLHAVNVEIAAIYKARGVELARISKLCNHERATLQSLDNTKTPWIHKYLCPVCCTRLVRKVKK